MPHELSQLIVGLVATMSILLGLSFIVNIICLWRFETIFNTINTFEGYVCLAVIIFMTLAYLVQLVINIKKELLADKEKRKNFLLWTQKFHE
jgi:hypothetical protein